MSHLFDQIAEQTPKHIQDFVDLSFDLADRIHSILQQKAMSQKEFAKALGKQESEISKWLAGTHNFTLKTLCKIQAVLGEDIIQIKASAVLELPVNKLEKQKWNTLILDKKNLNKPSDAVSAQIDDKYPIAA